MRISDWSSDVCSSDLKAKDVANTIYLVRAHKFQAQIGSIMNSFVIHWPEYVIGQIEVAFRALVGADSLNGPLCIIPPNRSETALLALVYANELVRVEVLNRGPACRSVLNTHFVYPCVISSLHIRKIESI